MPIRILISPFAGTGKHCTITRSGPLVVTSSGTARFGAAGSEHYSATKAGVIALVQSLAVGQARYGIRANAIIPGWIETAMTERAFDSRIAPSSAE